MQSSTTVSQQIGLVTIPLVQQGQLVHSGPSIPSEDLWILHTRVRRGVVFLRWKMCSSAWMAEVLMSDFNIQHLRIRAHLLSEGTYMARAFLKAQELGYNPVHLGLDLESEVAGQGLYFGVLNDLWNHHALVQWKFLDMK